MGEVESGPAAGLVLGIAAVLRRERTRAGLSLSELAARAGVAKSTLSQLEAGHGNPGVETLWRLCTALNIAFGQLMEPARPAVRVIRAGEGPSVGAELADYRATTLAPAGALGRHEMYRIVAEPGEPRLSEPHQPGVVEHAVLAAGRALVGPPEDPVTLEVGDYAVYPGDRPHLFQALEPGTWAVMVLDYP